MVTRLGHPVRDLVVFCMGLVVSCALLPLAIASPGFTDQEQERIKALNENLVLFDRDYQDKLGEFSSREQVCLSKFISASCLDELRRDAAQVRRQHELAKELLRRDIRQIEADVRHRQRLEAADVRNQRLGQLGKPTTQAGPFTSDKVQLD
ncbi:MAG: hypothetical protein ACO3TF_01160 [Burkholderiaceae bacterium]